MAIKYKDIVLAYSEVVRQDSGLYGNISAEMAEDKEMKLLLQPINEMDMMPRLMSAVLFELYHQDHPLKEYYFNFTESPKVWDKEGYLLFKSFVSHHIDAIITHSKNADMKKNVVERSSVLVPIFHHIINASHHELFNVIEVGSRAGLLLNYDWYGYTFNKSVSMGDTESFNIKVKIKGYEDEYLRPLRHPAHKIGISDKVIDLNDDEEYTWMLCQLYPEDVKRRKNLMKARNVFLEHPIDLREGDELDLLEEALMQLPDDEPIIIFHIHHTKKWSDVKKMALLQLIKKYSSAKEIYHIHHQLFGNEIYLDYYKDELLIREKLATFDLDKMKIDWLYNQPVKL